MQRIPLLDRRCDAIALSTAGCLKTGNHHVEGENADYPNILFHLLIIDHNDHVTHALAASTR